MSGEPNPPIRRLGAGDKPAVARPVKSAASAQLDLWRLVDAGVRPLRWLLDRGRANRLRRARLAPVRMIDRSLLLRLGAGPGGAR